MAVTGLHAQDLSNIAKEKPFQIHGSVSVGGGYYLSSGFNNTRKPYTYFINAAPVISIYGVQIPFNFTMTEGSKTLTNPFAQFGINPSWKWIKAYGGWTNMSWSPTTLNGKTFLGAGIEINPSLFRFGAMYGRLNPAIKENLLGAAPQQPQFKRKGYAFKLGVGNQDNFFDFIYLKGKDVSSSIPTPSDTMNQLNYTPAENAVFGINSYQSFWKKQITWQLDGAVSAYTRNTNSQLYDIGSGGAANFANKIIPIRLSTGYSWTAHTNITYKGKRLTLGADYSRIQPEYQSMGLDYIVNDQQKITLNQAITSKKGKAIVSLMQFFQNDNLNKRKALKTNRAGLNATLTLIPNQKFGITFSYNNFLMFQQNGLKEVNDTTKLTQVQQTIAIAPHYTIINTKFVHNISSVLTYNRLDDLNKFTAQYSRNSTINGNVSYSLTMLKINMTIAPGINVLYSKIPIFDVMNISPTLAVSNSFWKGKISTAVAFTYTASRQANLWNAHTINNTLSIGYRITNMHALRFTNNITRTTYVSTNTTGEYRGEMTYTLSF